MTPMEASFALAAMGGVALVPAVMMVTEFKMSRWLLAIPAACATPFFLRLVNLAILG